MQPPYNSEGALKLYGNFQGLDINGDPIIDPTTGEITRFMNLGDPINNSGWLPDYCREIYFMQGSGPFTMAPLDTQRVLYAVIIGHSTDRLSSVLDLKRNTDFVRNSVKSEFTLDVVTETQTNCLSDTETEVYVQTTINHEHEIFSVKADFYTYYQNHLYSTNLLDDGQVDNGIAGDDIFGNVWTAAASDSVAYVSITVTDIRLQEHQYRYADYNLTLSDKLTLHNLSVVDDHINQDGLINPGENVRMGLSLRNDYDHALKSVKIFLESDDPLVSVHPGIVIIDSLGSVETFSTSYDLNDEETFFELDIAPGVRDTHNIDLKVHILDDKLHHWKRYVKLRIEPLNYEPNLIVPSQIDGRSDARFAVRVIYPEQLTGHTYWLTVSDSVNGAPGKGFNLTDKTLGLTLLENHPNPDEFAYNIPITDGFKVVEADLPESELSDVYYQDVENGNEQGFEIVSISQGNADYEDMYSVDLVFSNQIDSSRIVGIAEGQDAYQYVLPNLAAPENFLSVPFEAWKVSNNNRLNLLDVCFQENPYFDTYDDQWAPDASTLGGLEILYIMKSDYDPSGSRYQGQNLDMKNVMYKLHVRLASESAVVDAGDKIVFDWVAGASSEDVFSFVPTQIEEEKAELISDFKLYQNYPNPFNAATTIQFKIEQKVNIDLKIYNVRGQLVTDLIDSNYLPGNYSILWDCYDKLGYRISSGLYFAKLSTERKTSLIKMLLIR